MQPKARMTFRFDPPPPAPRPQPAATRDAAAIESAGTERDPVTENRDLDNAPNFEAPQPGPNRKSYYAGGPLQDDLYTLEEMIRNAEPIRIRDLVKEAPVKSPVPEQGQAFEQLLDPIVEPAEWSPPDTDDHRMEGWLSGALSRKEGPSWWRVFASVAGAVATGALFGYLVLTLFTGDSRFPAATNTVSDTPAQAPAPSGAATRTIQSTVPPPGGDSQTAQAAEIAESSFYLLQYGVFRSEESMSAAMQELKNKGLPSAADRSDGYRVYVGAADSKAEADALARHLSGLEVYVKPTMGEAVVPSAEDGGAELAAFVRRSDELARQLARLSVKALQDEQLKAMDPAALAALRESHKLWSASAKATARLTGKPLEAAKAIEQELNTAMVSVDDYSRKTAKIHLWNIQSEVMRAVIQDRSLRTAIRNDR